MKGLNAVSIQQGLKLPRVFIFAAFVNFIVGSTFGGIMASQESLWPVLSAYHAELNPFGWLTMLIYGMTYVVLFLSLGLQLPRRWQGALHVSLAEGGILLVVLALLLQSPLVDRIGLVVQGVAPLVFMANILSMVIGRKRAREKAAAEDESGAEGTSNSVKSAVNSTPESFQTDVAALFGVVDEFKATDSVAQRGTDVSLMIFIAACIWMIVHAFIQPITWPFETGQTPQLLMYYGWIAGTVLAVAMHLYPRLLGIRSIQGWYVQIGQIAWGIGVVLLLAGSVWSPLGGIGGRVVGFGIAWQAIAFLATLKYDAIRTRAIEGFGVLHVVLWIAAWFFAMVLGVLLVLGISPMSLAALHLLFLGWITTLVYSVGYRVFPLLLGKAGPPVVVAVLQAAMAVIGAIMMPLAFIQLMHGGSSAFVQLTIGGTLAALGALFFLLQWIFSRGTKVS